MNQQEEWERGVEQFECSGFRCTCEVAEKHYVITKDDLRTLITAAEARGRSEAVDYIKQHSKYHENPIEDAYGGFINGGFYVYGGDLEAARTGNLSGDKN